MTELSRPLVFTSSDIRLYEDLKPTGNIFLLCCGWLALFIKCIDLLVPLFCGSGSFCSLLCECCILLCKQTMAFGVT